MLLVGDRDRFGAIRGADLVEDHLHGFLDRDHGDEKPYSGIRIKEYNTVGNAKVWYTPSFTEEDITALSKDADVVYSCGPYNDYARIAMKLKRSGKITALLFVATYLKPMIEKGILAMTIPEKPKSKFQKYYSVKY